MLLQLNSKPNGTEPGGSGSETRQGPAASVSEKLQMRDLGKRHTNIRATVLLWALALDRAWLERSTLD